MGGTSTSADVTIVGAGAVGISAARHLATRGVKVVVLEKETGPALHQSGRNSGVIHAGYNPKPGTEKARYCVEGNRQLREYCQRKGIPHSVDGILVVARTPSDVAELQKLAGYAEANGTAVRMLDGPAEIRSVEPFAQGEAALQARDGGSLDPVAYVHAIEADAKQAGATFTYRCRVRAIEESDTKAVVLTENGRFVSRVVINAAGLYADELAGQASRDMRVIPFRGYYAELAPRRRGMVNSHIYGVPDPDFPFLGVHLSRRVDDRVIVGPGAMLAFGREAYRFLSFRGGRLGKTLGWRGFWPMLVKPKVRRLIRSEVAKSLSLRAIWKEARLLVPQLEPGDLVRSLLVGNRAQMVDRHGEFVWDIVIEETPHAIHVLNVVSPGLTCSLPFGAHLADRAERLLQA